MTDNSLLNPVIHTQARLRIISTLSSLHEGNQITFSRLQKILDMTAGNLSTHLLKLEEVGYIRQEKTFERRTPVTYISLTTKGNFAFEEYVTTLNSLIQKVTKL